MGKKPPWIKLSHSAIACFKRCPWAWMIAYLWGIRPEQQAEALYDGGVWHRGVEILSFPEESVCEHCADKSKADPDCYFCQGTTFMVGTPMEVCTRMVVYKYSTYGSLSQDAVTKMETKRTIILYSLAAYAWRWQDDDAIAKVLACELRFDTQLINSVTGNPFARVNVVGVIDKLLKLKSKKLSMMEHKSTSQDIGVDSLFWNKLRFDPQTTLYPWALRDMQAKGELRRFKVKETDAPVTTVYYDVWRKPKSKPKKLTAALAKELITSGMYCDEQFEVEATADENIIKINGEETPRYPNAKGTGCQIQETQRMFGARLMQDMTTDPDKYFARREITRTTQDLAKFEQQMVRVTRTMRHMISMDCFYQDSSTCDDYGGCDSRTICYEDLSVGQDDVPTGYKCIFHEKGNPNASSIKKTTAASNKKG